MARVKELWIVKNWKIIILIMYCAICMFDFLLMPLIVELSHIKIVQTSEVLNRWNPITLQGGGVFHMAVISLLTGAIMGSKPQQK